MTELTELIRTKSSSSSDEVEDSARFVSFFPDFIWTVRDFMLELELDGIKINFLIPVKYFTEILIWITLNLKVDTGRSVLSTCSIRFVPKNFILGVLLQIVIFKIPNSIHSLLVFLY